MITTIAEALGLTFSPHGFVPRRICGLWPDWLIWEHVIGNALIWLAYIAIPVVIWRAGYRKTVLAPFPGLEAAFANFIFLCGLGHLLDMVAFVRPMYRFSGHVLIATGAASWWTVLSIRRAWPALITMRSPAELEAEVAARIEELALANQSLREGEARLRQMADAMPQIVWTAAPDGRVEDFNDRWYELTGLPRGAVAESDWLEVLHPDDRESCLAAWSESVREGMPYQIEYRFRDHATALYRWHLGRAIPARDQAGRIVKWIGTCTDIDDRKRSEVERDRLLEQLDAERRQLRAVIDSSHDGIKEIDLDGRAVSLNAAAMRHLELEVGATILGKPWLDLWQGPSWEDARSAMSVAIAGGVGSFEGFRQTARGSPKWWVVTVTPILDALGRPNRLLCVSQDVTERKRHAEERERLLAEAQEANRAKDHFLAVLSHELRTPLNPILLAASSLRDRDLPPAELHAMMEMIRHNVGVQSRLIDDLLDVMRIVTGKMPLHLGVTDGHAVIRHAVQVCQGDVVRQGIDLSFEPGALRHHVRADAARLQQVFWNLIKNAVKFSPDGGSIRITTRNPGDDPAILIVEVADTGIGIEPDILPKIFDPFQQGETSITRRFGGLGLGLAISRGVMEAHGGTIVAESPGPGWGTTFRIDLMTTPEPEISNSSPQSNEIPALPAANVSHSRGLATLVVEDEPATNRLMARLLRGLGHTVTTAATRSEAIAALNAARFDLIVSDIGLPDGSGLDVMRHAVATQGRVPAIALTGYGMEEDIVRSREAGFSAHMTKPIDFAKLEALIHRVAPIKDSA